jgi:hypothetical protein
MRKLMMGWVKDLGLLEWGECEDINFGGNRGKLRIELHLSQLHMMKHQHLKVNVLRDRSFRVVIRVK